MENDRCELVDVGEIAREKGGSETGLWTDSHSDDLFGLDLSQLVNN